MNQLVEQPGGPIVVIGAGIGGLSAALRLAASGCDVTVVDQHDDVGGKMRTVPSAAGPVDAGPTVMTMRDVFDDLFAAAGARLEDHLTLSPQHILARHWWSDDSTLDLFADSADSKTAIERFAGAKEAEAFARFSDRARELFEAFEDPMMKAAQPSQTGLAAKVIATPSLLLSMRALSSLASALARDFSDPRLRQLFGRYATYVGGSPYRAPALLSLIWHAEASGVWTVNGGMHRLAQALSGLIQKNGGQVMLSAPVRKIEFQDEKIHGVVLESGRRLPATRVVFNGDPKALYEGRLGQQCTKVVKRDAVQERSLSAYVWSFAAHASGASLVHHNVFFGDTAKSEFDDLARGDMPTDPTLYICAQDRDDAGQVPDSLERFEIIMNAPPHSGAEMEQEFETCRTRTFNRLKQMGLRFSPEPGAEALTTPAMFNQLFPASDGSLYGRSPHGLMAAMKRPLARTAIPGLYLAGGGAHPGAGIPMAALSGKHAAEAILQDQFSTSPSRRTAMRGGISTGSAMTDPVRSRSSAS